MKGKVGGLIYFVFTAVSLFLLYVAGYGLDRTTKLGEYYFTFIPATFYLVASIVVYLIGRDIRKNLRED